MTSILDTIIAGMENNGAPTIISENHDIGAINWVNGMSDPGEMIACGYLPELRRHDNETDEAYAARLNVLIAQLPEDVRAKINTLGMQAAIKRAGMDTTGGRINLMVAGAAAWHRLGVNVESAVNSAHAIKLGGLDWQVAKAPAQYRWNDEFRTMNDQYILVRQDTGAALATVGKVYKPLQNGECFAFLDSVLQEFGARYESVGSLYGGQKIFLCAQLPQQAFSVRGNDPIMPYGIFMNYHGYGAAQCFASTKRAECDNTLTIALRERNREKSMSIRHTGKLETRIDEAREALGLAVRAVDTFKGQCEQLASTPMGDVKSYAGNVLDEVLGAMDAKRALVAELIGADRAAQEEKLAKEEQRRAEILEDILQRYESRTNGINGMRGTAWAGFNAITEHADHNRIGRQRGNELDRAARRFESSLSGDADEMKQTALTLALAAR
jgi:phage/plasmid-like protein (TIGR03299 family)